MLHRILLGLALAAGLLLACSDDDPLEVTEPLVLTPSDTTEVGETPPPPGGGGGEAPAEERPDTLDTGGGDTPPHPGSEADASVRFAVIGDFGKEGPAAASVAELVASWSPEFVVTTGDNNYVYGELETFDENVGQYYCEFIYNPGAPEGYGCRGRAWRDSTNRFFPSVGNHDYLGDESIAPYLAYFDLPGNELYYTIRRGPVAFYALDSENRNSFAAQRAWLAEQTAASDALYHVAYFHKPPYSTAHHGDQVQMQWDFTALGIDVVLTGHEHNYQRILGPGAGLYLVNGVGGASLRDDCFRQATAATEVVVCEDRYHGALRATADAQSLRFEFVTADGVVRDSVSVAPRR